MQITVEPIPAAAIAEAWPVLGPILAPAIAFDANVTDEIVRDRLISGQCEAAYVVSEGVSGVIVTEMCAIDGVSVCWASYVAGTAKAGPRAWVSSMRALMAHFEGLARLAGCKEMRVGGRNWSRILPEYEPIDGGPNHMRKRL